MTTAVKIKKNKKILFLTEFDINHFFVRVTYDF